jgi:putative ABC transport system permease protein
MTLLESLRTAWEALAANKLRSLLTMLGIIIGVGSVIAIIAIGRGTSAAVSSELEGFGAGLFQVMPRPPGPNDREARYEPLTEADVKLVLDLLPDVQGHLVQLGMGATLKWGRNSVQTGVMGTSANAPELLNLKLAEGRWFTKEEEASAARVLVLGADSVEQLMEKGRSPIGERVMVNGYPYTVIGVMAKDTGLLTRLFNQQDNAYYVPLTVVQAKIGHVRDLGGLLLKAKPGADPEVVKNDVIALLEHVHKGARYNGFTFAQAVDAVNSVTGIITSVMAAIAGISLLVGGVGIMNIMLVSVTERTREIGIRKAIGATYGNILLQFLIESVLISVIGGLIGVGLAMIPTLIVGRLLQIDLLVDLASIALALGFSAGVGILFGVYPASKAARLDPIEALRYE